MSDSDTELTLTSDTNFNAKSGEGMVLIDEGASTEEIAYATGKTGATLAIPLANRGLEGGAAAAHTTSSTVKGILTAGMWNNLIDSIILLIDKTAGTIKSSISFTTPKVVTSINDTNGNELLKVTATSSAVNEITLANAATAGNPTITASGGDDNVGIDFKPKGTGTVRLPVTVVIQVLDGPANTSTGDGKAYFTIPEELNGMNLVGVHARVITAGTTGTTDIQIRNVTDTQDMLSTKLTIDSTETGSDTAATAAVINASYDDVATNDLIAIDVDAVHTTPAKGLIVRLRFALP